jgi:RNA polymerase I-specific transcription initiation factor RRN6
VFLDVLRQIQNPDETSTSKVVLSDLTKCPSIQFSLDQAASYPDSMKVFNQLLENWIASLPLGVSHQARLAKFNIIRQTAVELFLSSIAVSLRNKTLDVSTAPIQNDEEDFTRPQKDKYHSTTRESSPVNFSYQMTSSSGNQPHIGLPTPSQTPSLYSRPSLAPEVKEDPAISRLQQYAVSIKAKPDFGTSPILLHWPSAPGSDPTNYSWESKQKVADEDQRRAETKRRDRNEEARRRRRTQDFLARETVRAGEPISQPMVVTPSGSQPVVAHSGFSSQTVEDIPMTQPDRGVFGSRSLQKTKKKPKKHRTAGF